MTGELALLDATAQAELVTAAIERIEALNRCWPLTSW